MTKIISQYKFHLLIFILSFLILARFKIDPDLGWHLAYGREFLENGQILRGDIFSWTMPDYVWGNSYFAFQILTAFLFQNLGYLLSVIFFGIVAGAAVLMILPKRLNFGTVLIIGLASALALANVGVRPHNLDWPFFSLLLILIEKKFFRSKIAVFFWFVFFAVWANFHVGFVFGLLMLIAMILINLGRDLYHRERKLQVISVFAIVAAFGGTFLTPFHLGMWKSIFFDSAGLVGWMNIAALQPTVVFTPFNFFLALSGLIYVYILRSKIKKIESAWLIVASFVFLLAFFVIDFVYIWVLVFIFIGARHFEINLDFGSGHWPRLGLMLPIWMAFLAIVLNSFVIFLEFQNFETQLKKDLYPVDAVNFLSKNHLGENLFNEYSWGGYLDWQYPGAKVFIDGRMAGWRKTDGGHILSDYLAIRKGDCAVAQKYPIKVLLLKRDSKVECFGNWSVIYEDSVAKIYMVRSL